MSSIDPLVQPGDLVHQYSFTVPKIGTTDNDGFAYGGAALAFHPLRNSLFIVGKEDMHRAAEISIPLAPGIATVLQSPVDVTEGTIGLVNPTSTNMKVVGGLLPWGQKLYIAAYDTYDGGEKQRLSHFVSGQTLATTGDLQGPFQIGTLPVGSGVGTRAGWVSAYMGVVPQAWRAALGGPAFTGNCCIAIVGRTSLGPAVSTFDPADVGVKNPVPDTPLLYYDLAHPTLGTWSSSSPLYNGTAKMGGVVMPEGSRSVLFFGRIGSRFGYGVGTKDLALDGDIVGSGPDHYWYDLEDQSKGTHGYPYRYQVWAYDANDLAAVKAGAMKPWEPKPYAVWELKFPTASPFTRIMGVAYDPTTQRIFVSQARAAKLPGGTDAKMPVIHVFTVNI